jgi:hypothetical protein
VRVGNQPLHQDVYLTGIHGAPGRYHASKPLGNAGEFV